MSWPTVLFITGITTLLISTTASDWKGLWTGFLDGLRLLTSWLR